MEDIKVFLEKKRKYRTKFKGRVSGNDESFVDRIFKQLVLSMGILTVLFTLKFFPVTSSVFSRVQAVVAENYFDEVVSVFNQNED